MSCYSLQLQQTLYHIHQCYKYFLKSTRSGVRTHEGFCPLELKSNALTTRPSWWRPPSLCCQTNTWSVIDIGLCQKYQNTWWHRRFKNKILRLHRVESEERTCRRNSWSRVPSVWKFPVVHVVFLSSAASIVLSSHLIGDATVVKVKCNFFFL